MRHTAVNSTADGSVIIDVDMNVSEAEKELKKLKNQIEKTENDIKKAMSARDKAADKKTAAETSLEEQVKKLEEMKTALEKNVAIEKQLKPISDEALSIQTRINRLERERTNALERQQKVAERLAEEKQRLEEIKSLDIFDEDQVKAIESSVNKIGIELSSINGEIYEFDAGLRLNVEKLRELDKAAEKLAEEIPYEVASDEQLKEQEKSIKQIKADWERASKDVERYDEKINDSTAQLVAQKTQAGDLQKHIDDTNAEISKMAVADQHVVDINKELLALKERQKELSKLGVGFGFEEFDRNAARIAEINQELKDYQKTLAEIKAAGPVLQETGHDIDERRAEILTRQQEIIGKVSEKLQSLNALVSDVAGSIGQKLTTAFAPLYEKIAPTLNRIKTSIADAFSPLFQNLDLGALKNIPSRLASAFSSLKGFANVGSQIGSTAGAFRSILDNASNAAKAIGHFGIVASKSFLSAAKNALVFAGKLNIFSKLSDGVTNKFSRLGQMIRRVFVFSVITSGLRAIRQQLSGYLKVNAEFMTALRRLQGVFLTAFQPIYDVIVPALTTLINVLARATAVVSSFFATLFGTTAKQAQANAKSLYEQANATAAAGGAAEEASKQLAGFDEINKLESNKSGGGGGGGGVETGPLFDFEYEETPFESWGEAFSAFLDKLLAGIPKLRDAFKNLADGLNDWSKKVYDMFTFPGVLDKVKELGKELADAFNDLVNWINWRQLGQAIGAGLNTALNFLTSFLYEFDWMNLGRKLAEFVNGLASEIDWYEFGRLLWSGFKIGLETLAGFIVGLDMPLMAKAASQTVMGFFDEMTNTINRIPWKQIGLQIATFLTSLDWAGMFNSVYNAIKAALEGIRGLLTGFFSGLGKWTDPLIGIVNTVIDTIERLMDVTKQWASSLDLSPISNAFGNLLTAIDKLVAVIADGLLWAYENVLLPLAGWAIEETVPVVVNALAAAMEFLAVVLDKLGPVAAFIINDVLKPIGIFAWSVLSGELQVITNILKKLTDLLSGNTTFREFWENLAPGEKIVLGIAAALLAMTNPLALATAGIIALTKAAENLIPGLREGIAKAWDSFKAWLSGLWQAIVDGFKSFFGIHSPSTLMAELGGNLIAGLLQGISQAWNSIVSFFTEVWQNLTAFLTETWEALKTAATEKFTKIKDKVGEAWDTIKQKTSEIWESVKAFISETWENLKSWATEKFEAIKQTISTAWDNVKQKSSETWESIKTTLSEIWNNLVSWAQEKFEAIKQKISDVWENVKTFTTNTWENLKTSLGNAWEYLKTTASARFEEIRAKISEAWENVKTATANAWESAKSTVSSALSDIWNNVTSTFSNLVSSALTWGKDLCQNIADGIGNGIRKVKDAVKDVADTIKDFVGFSEPKKGPLSNFHTFMPDMLELMSDGIRDNTYMATKAASDLANGVAEALNRRTYTLGNINMGRMPDFSNMRIPKLAQGAVIPPNREFMAVLGDQKHGNNIEAPVSEIESAVARAMRSVGMGGNGGNITVVMEIDGREFGRASYKYGTAEQQRVGVRMTEART